MNALLKALSYIGPPALLGLVLAACVWLFFPSIFDLKPLNLNTDRSASTGVKYGTGPVSYADAVNAAAPSVVNIYTLREQRTSGRYNPFTNRRSNGQSRVTPVTGSGVIVSTEGYIITNLHVIDLARDIRVALQDGREATPEIVGISEEDDMAVLRINLDNLQPIEIGNPDHARVGDVVLAIGNPFGVGQTVTQGIISGTRRKGLNIAQFENFLQTDAAINPGNSGGALVDAYGRLLGINISDLRQTSYGDASGIGFAIPADRAMQAMTDIVEYGRVVRGWLGLSALDLNPQIVQKLQLNTDDGVLITDIYTNGPADIAGLLRGDIIQAINGNATPNMLSAKQEFANLRPGDLISMNVIRQGQLFELEAVLSAAPPGAAS